jgi:hypothetical protein
MAAAGNSNTVRRYEWIHATPKQGINYYRIRQTDKDGRYSYSKTVALPYQKNGGDIVVFPNPARENLTVMLPESIRGSINNMKIINVLGQPVIQQNIAVGTRQFNIKINNLQRGFYRIIIVNETGTQSVSFIKN